MKDAQTRLEPLHTVTTPVLEIAYAEFGPADGQPVVLLHGYPYDIHSYVDVAPILAGRGYRVLVPYLRGHGPTRFLSRTSPRSGQQAALGKDVIDFLDALDIPRAILAGYDWGGRAACVAAALWPHRVEGIVSVNSYLIQDIAASMSPLDPELEAGFWYFFYFLTDRGYAGLEKHRTQIAEVIWRRNSPDWLFDDAMLERSAEAFRNPDYVDVVIHSYRHRLGQVAGADEYEPEEAVLSTLPAIRVPAVTLDGLADGNFPATDGSPSASRFTGPRVHHQIPRAGHNLPQEAPFAFAQAVLEVARLGELDGARRLEAIAAR
ncbi:alpha/beta fold hydrolase [Protaetiibacter intestinalis]|uniref:Alpha/beta hydrolase n=1 Tax=Protaetiibacter intestinalis TaxID=2419774 RepID=A0A387B0Z8_9MICO|nr:alpha/beta hydrolase [Protaetiibacter intestinalis]AYF97172.1 alpha/beta hydrolase [Protaetiibacter intestinalis]